MHDFVIVGGGIVGLATGMALRQRFPTASLLLLEKEKRWADHQTGRNSGVIHSGIYYKPGSLKARLAVEGNRRMVQFCREQGIPHEVCGKLIVATRPEELPRLDALLERGRENGLTLTKLDAAGLKAIEPHATGLAALHVPSTGIIQYRQVAERMADLLSEGGAELRAGAEVRQILNTGDGVEVSAGRDSFRARRLINCAGLQCDRVARLAGLDPGVRIVPFRGEYFKLKAAKRNLVRHLTYPVPDPRFPFLGVHFTRMISGEVEAGPNAVLSLKREGYSRTAFSPRDALEAVTYPGVWKLIARYWKESAGELGRSRSKPAFVRSLQRLIPEIQAEDLEPAPPGVRAQALRPDGSLVDDFLIRMHGNCVHVLNAPSPAATASLVIGEAVAETVAA